MPTSPPDPHVLRGRATALRRLSLAITTSEAIDLRHRAGDEVWIGPTATRCADDLIALGRRLQATGDDLVLRAKALERRAFELELVVAGVGPH
jgi:hypothetical protein